VRESLAGATSEAFRELLGFFFLPSKVLERLYVKKRGCEKRIVPKKERPRVYNELKVFLSVIINLQ